MERRLVVPICIVVDKTVLLEQGHIADSTRGGLTRQVDGNQC